MTTDIKAISESVKTIGDGFDAQKMTLDSALEQIFVMEKKLGRMQFSGNVPSNEKVSKHGLEEFLRKGNKDGLMEKAALSTVVDAEGGYTVVPHLDDKLIETIAETNPILRDAAREVIDSNKYQQVFTITGAVSGRVAEKGTRNATDGPVYARPSIDLTMQFAYPSVTEELALSSAFDIGGHVVREIVTAFDADFEAEMIGGNGTAPNQKGFLTAADSTDADSVRAFGSYQLVPSTVSASFNYDDLVTLTMSLAPKYRKRAKFYASTSAVTVMRKLKDTAGNPLWIDANGTTGQPQSFMSYVVEECTHMPAVGALAKCLAFGDLQKAYKFVSHKSGLQILRDPYTSAGNIKYYCRLLCGSGPMDTRALKVLRPVS